MKIVKVDNFGRDYKLDVLIVEKVDKENGEIIVRMLNETITEYSDDYFMLKDDDYVLWRGMEELI